MSKFLQNTTLSPRRLEQSWINGCIHLHDLCCGCPEPLTHLKHLLQKEECLPTTDAATTSTEETGGINTKEEINIDEGDLEKLFELTDEDLG